jgi:hypothetical protein
MNNRYILRYFFIASTFLGTFSTYPKAVHQAQAEEPVGDVIEISTPEQFQNINNDLTAHYIIMNDIDFTGFELTQIASYPNQPFEGILDGNGYRLKNIVIPKTFHETLVSVNNHARHFSYSLFRYNEGVIRNVTFENLSHETHIVSTQFVFTQLLARYSFSVIEYNLGTLQDLRIRWSLYPLIFEGAAYEIDASLLTIENRGLIQNISIHGSTISPWKINSSAVFKLVGLAIDNYGTIDQTFFSLSTAIHVNSNGHNIHFSGAVYQNHASGIVTNIYLNTSVSLVLFIADVTSSSRNLWLKVSGIVHYNYGLIEYFYNTGSLNLVMPMDFIFENYDIELGRSTFLNTSIDPTDESGETRNGFSNLLYRFLTLSQQFLLTSLNSISRDFPNAFLLSNATNMTQNTVEFGHLDETFHHLYTFVAETGSLADDYTSPFVNDFYGYIFNLNHFLIIQETLESTTPGLTPSSPLELSQQLLTSEAWSDSQLSDINAFVLTSITLLPFELSNYSIQGIGTLYTVSEDIDVSLNGVLLEPGIHYLNDPGQFLFTLYDPLLNITNSVSVIVYSKDSILPEGTYLGSFTPQLDEGTIATLNGEPYLVGTPINNPGQHQLIIFGENNYKVKYDFTIHLVLVGINNNANYYESIKPTFSGGAATLNGDPYESDTLIENIGNYELIITGVNGFSETILFTILPNKGDLNDGETYYSGYMPIISGEGVTLTLNGNIYTPNTPIVLAGEYELIIQGLNNYEQRINFTIQLNLFNSIQNNGNYSLEVTPIFEGGYAILNGLPLESGTTIDQVGQYTLMIYGLDDILIETIQFHVHPSILNETDGSLTSYTPNIQGGSSYTLNNEAYIPYTPITTPGDYTLVVYGLNGYTFTYNFTIALRVDGLDKTVKASYFQPFFSGGTATLNGLPFYSGDIVTDVGHYELIVVGVNGFRNTFYFTVIPSIQSIIHEATYQASVTPNITGTGMTIRFNGELIDDINYPITNPGINTIVINGENNYEHIITFTINPTINAPTQNAELLNQNVLLSWSGGIAELNGATLDGNTFTVNSIGKFTFILRGINNGFQQSHSFTIRPLVQNLINNNNYSGPIQPNIIALNGTIELNGQPYNNERIATPGLHTLIIFGEGNYTIKYSFFINLNISGVQDGQSTINQPLIVNFSGGLATLNGMFFQSGGLVDRVGHYTLVITGVSDFEQSLSFSILPSIQGISNLAIYKGNVTPIINANGATITLNNQPYSGEEITMPGNHVLRIYGEGSYFMIVTFKVNLITSGFKYNQSYINTPLTLNFSGGNATLNGVAIQSGHITQLVGHHTLIISGVNGFTQTFLFTIHPELNFNPSDIDIYSGSFTPEIYGQGISILHNNQPYNGDTITMPGTHSLLVTSPIGNYSTAYHFSITLVSNNLQDNTTYTDWITPTFSGGIISINGQPFTSGTRIETLGFFTLIVRGTGDFIETFSFIILAYDIVLPENNSSQPSFIIQVNGIHSLTELTLNSVSYSSNITLLSIGHYDVVITFNGTVLLTQRFTIEPNDYHQDGTVFDAPLVLNYPYGELYVNGNLYVNGYRMDRQGTYTIVIRGVNGYEHTYTLMFDNPNVDRVSQLLMPLALSMALPTLAYFIRRRRGV